MKLYGRTGVLSAAMPIEVSLSIRLATDCATLTGFLRNKICLQMFYHIRKKKTF